MPTTRRTFLTQSALYAGAMTAAGRVLADASNTRETAGSPTLLKRAESLLEQAPLIDTHNDLPSMFIELSAGDLTGFDLTARQPKLCADIPALRSGGVGAQYWSIFVESSTQTTHVSLHEALREFDVALRFVQWTVGI